MYEDSWYSFVPDVQQKKKHGLNSHGPGHRRKESLLQQSNVCLPSCLPSCRKISANLGKLQKGTIEPTDAIESLPGVYEDDEDDQSPPDPTLIRRAKSYSDFFDIVQAKISQSSGKRSAQYSRSGKKRAERGWQALAIDISPTTVPMQEGHSSLSLGSLGRELLAASQQDYLLYHDQLAATERHLAALVQDTNSTLNLLQSLSQSFRAVNDQTTSFQSQCDDLLSEQKRLQVLAEEVGNDLDYYAYLDNVSRRLNAPGAGRLVDDDAFAEVLSRLDACIAFMTENSGYRDAESYLARYQALLTKALHLLEVGFTNHLEKVSGQISKQIAATQSESARHALAYGRFEELIAESYSLIPNIQRVTLNAYDQLGYPKKTPSFDTYANTANNIFDAYWTVRDRDLKPILQLEVDTYKAEAKSSSVETATRNYVKQCFERSYNEAVLFSKIFSIDPQYSTEAQSAFVSLKSHPRGLVSGVNIAPIAVNVQAVLQPTDLQTICSVVGWITNEYVLLDYDEEESRMTAHCRDVAARLLSEHFWALTDTFFDAEITKSITKIQVLPDSLKIGPVVDNVPSSNAYPPVKKALEFLVLFDRSMPKERCQRNSPVVFKIIKETIAALHRAEARIKATKNGTDPDLFMIKNLLILKNELMSLEIGDVYSQEQGMQYFGQIWETLRPQNLMGLLSSFSSYIPGSMLWSRSNTASPAPTTSTKPSNAGLEAQDASEQLDELLRQSIYAFTNRWATTLGNKGGKLGGKSTVKAEKELGEILDRSFSNQPEVVAKLREAIQANIDMQNKS